jgi:4-hydroxy-4-methyl-2-oxoglutarate aldolase
VALEPLPTAELADAAGFPIALDARIRPIWRSARLAGPVFTVRTLPCEFLAVQEAAKQAPGGAVLVVDGGGQLRCALWGDKMSALALERGLAGLVVDGPVRDVDGIEALGFPVFAAGIVPTGPWRERMAGELGIPITCGGVEVRPGDYVYGDTDGVVVVPRERHDEIVARVRTS